MKLLSAMELLKDQSEIISLSEFRAAIGDVISQVELGKTFKITRRRKIIAIVTKAPLVGLEVEVNKIQKKYLQNEPN